MKRLIPILAVCLTFGCTGTTTTNNVKQPPTATVVGRYIEGGASRSAYVYNHKTNSDVIRFSYEYTKEQLDSVYGTCTRHEEDDDPCDGGFARWYDDKGIRLDFQFGNFNGRENKWLSAVYMIKGDYTLHITDSLVTLCLPTIRVVKVSPVPSGAWTVKVVPLEEAEISVA